MRNFISYMLISFNHNRTACINEFELFPIIANPTSMNTGNNQLPPKIVFEPDQEHTNTRVEQHIEGIVCKELISV